MACVKDAYNNNVLFIQIQVFHEPCSWGTSYKCAVNCGVAVHSIYGHKKEVQMITRCGSHGTNSIVKVLKCQQEETNKVLINKSGTTYWVCIDNISTKFSNCNNEN